MNSSMFHAAQWQRRFRNLLIRAILQALVLLLPSVGKLLMQIHTSPGLPVENPTESYWMCPRSPVRGEEGNVEGGGEVVGQKELPEYADVVVIGSGITGTAFVRTLLEYVGKAGDEHGETGWEKLQVVMLEARDVCSGATGRNGGHITPVLYQEYIALKSTHGQRIAKQIIKFRLAHLPELLKVAAEEKLMEESQCREVEAFDVFCDRTVWEQAKSKLEVYRREISEEHAEGQEWRVWEGEEDMTDLQLSTKVVGCLSTRGGTVHPYRLVTGILARLLRSYPKSFRLFTHTPCTGIFSPSLDPSLPPHTSPQKQLYTVQTPYGSIQTPHVVHATNGWVSHLLPRMRGKIIPVRGVMTAQVPRAGLGRSISNHHHNKGSGVKTNSSLPLRPRFRPNLRYSESWTGTRSFVFYPSASEGIYDYLTQQPVPEPRLIKTLDREPKKNEREAMSSFYPLPRGELMFGGGWAFDSALLTELGNADDGGWNDATGLYLAGALARYFDVPAHKHEQEQELTEMKQEGPKEQVVGLWSGVLGISVDEKPWVGRVPELLAGRGVPMWGTEDKNGGAIWGGVHENESDVCAIKLAEPGEWMAAGYTGEGMVHAWMSGRALACMVLGLDKGECESVYEGMEAQTGIGDWFPDVFRVTQERWENATLEDLIAARWK